MSQSGVEQHEPQGEICNLQAAESRAAAENTAKHYQNLPLIPETWRYSVTKYQV